MYADQGRALVTSVDALLGQIVPAVEAAVGAYGVSVLTQAEDLAAGETVRLGQRLLARILNRGTDAASVEAAVSDLAEPGEDRDARDAQAALRFQIEKALREDPGFAAELSAMLPQRPTVQATGQGSVAVGGSIVGPVITGNNATFVALGEPHTGSGGESSRRAHL